MEKRKYQFDWSLIGNLETGRPNLGRQTSVEAYRLMMFTLRDMIELNCGQAMTDKLFYDAGLLAGKMLFQNFLAGEKDLSRIISKITQLFADLKIGIVRFEATDASKLRFILTVAEDLDCSGLPETGSEVCVYDEGVFAGLMSEVAGHSLKAKEVDCWCTGDRTCRFEVDPA